MTVWVVLDKDGRFVSVHGSERGAKDARPAFGTIERWPL